MALLHSGRNRRASGSLALAAAAVSFAAQAVLAPALARSGELRTDRGDQIDETLHSPLGESDVERLDRFIIFKEKLKSAVCDESFVSRAPTLESIAGDEAHSGQGYQLALGAETSEHELVSFLLGDGISGIYSEFVRDQIAAAMKTRAGLEVAVRARSLAPDQFLEAQGLVHSVKRRVSLDVCEALVNIGKLRKLLGARPSRFLEAQLKLAAGGRVQAPAASARFLVEVIDNEGRFGLVGDRISTKKRYLAPGWIEAFEVARITVLGSKGQPARIYRRLSNPLTNNTQSIEVMNAQGVPIGVLYLSREAPASDWLAYRNWAELPEARSKQIETYRQRVEIDAVQAVGRSRFDIREKVKRLQEFYKNLLQAYQLFPDEKQFEAYARGATAKKTSLDEVTRATLGADFLAALKLARVNGSHVHIGLFKPDAKLHAIYAEFADRLAKLAKNGE